MNDKSFEWQCGNYLLGRQFPAIMAIINVTPDSLSGDGLYGSVELALQRAEQALLNGAHILDVGGESTRPGSAPVSLKDELARIVPVVKALSSLGVPVSIDTVKPEVMAEAIGAGASIVNDINGLLAPNAIEVVSQSEVGVCLMHMQGQPRTMQNEPYYQDVVGEVESFLLDRAKALLLAGIRASRIALDPGFGFGKTLEHNLDLFRALPRIGAHGYPLLVGVSRKSMLGAVTGRGVSERMPASIAAALMAAQRGASILRVHDVAATRDALAMWAAIDGESLCAY